MCGNIVIATDIKCQLYGTKYYIEIDIDVSNVIAVVSSLIDITQVLCNILSVLLIFTSASFFSTNHRLDIHMCKIVHNTSYRRFFHA